MIRGEGWRDMDSNGLLYHTDEGDVVGSDFCLICWREIEGFANDCYYTDDAGFGESASCSVHQRRVDVCHHEAEVH